MVDGILQTMERKTKETQMANLTGHDREVQKMRRFRDASSLLPVVLIGPPGSGKSHVLSKVTRREVSLIDVL